jgi:carbon monoxide dehydrogenase subunit G
MRFENRFDVDAPLESVWEAMLDVERVAPTVPGAQVLEQVGDDTYKVAIKVKVGPMSMTYNGEVEITERDEAAHRAVMKARAKESRGQGTADADVTMVLAGEDGRTAATVTTEVQLSGKVATMGQAVLQDVSRRLVATFAENLAAMLAGEGPPEAPAQAVAGAGGAGGVPAADPSPPPAGAPGEAVPPPPPSAAAQAPPADALDLGSLGGAVLADRLRRPQTLPFLIAAVALVAFLLGRRSARR